MRTLGAVCAILAMASCSDPLGPSQVRTYVALAAGAEHTCAVTDEGSAYCWGRNRDGQLGTGGTADALVPHPVNTEVRFTDVTAGDAHTCALATDGRAFCWGWNAYYQLGRTYWADNRVPQPIESAARFVQISAGAHHTCGLSAEGRVQCWGYNRFGQNGNGKTVTTILPEEVAGDLRARSVAAGGSHTCVLTVAQSAICWGLNDLGQLGIGSDVLLVPTPTPVKSSLRFTALDAGRTHTCGIAGGLAFCWGSAVHGEIGDGVPFRPGLPGPSSPAQVRQLTKVTAISAGTHQSCAVAKFMSFCWGAGEWGQLGNGDTRDSPVPQDVLLQPRNAMLFTPLAAGGLTHACGINSGIVYCWGTGWVGQLGAAESTFSVLPQRVSDR